MKVCKKLGIVLLSSVSLETAFCIDRCAAMVKRFGERIIV